MFSSLLMHLKHKASCLREEMIMLSWCFQMEMREQMAYLGVWLEMLWEPVNNLSFVEVQGLEISMMKSLIQTKKK